MELVWAEQRLYQAQVRVWGPAEACGCPSDGSDAAGTRCELFGLLFAKQGKGIAVKRLICCFHHVCTGRMELLVPC